MIKRYESYAKSVVMEEGVCGNYVAYEDYEKLEMEFKYLQKKYQELSDDIRSLYLKA